MFRIVHHQTDEDGYKKGHDPCAVPDLVAINGTVPRGASMNDLIAQDIQPVEENGQHRLSVSTTKRPSYCTLTSLKS